TIRGLSPGAASRSRLVVHDAPLAARLENESHDRLVFRVLLVVVEGLPRGELGIERDIPAALGAREVYAHFQPEQAGDPAVQGLEPLLDQPGVLGLGGAFRRIFQPPHDYVLYHLDLPAGSTRGHGTNEKPRPYGTGLVFRVRETYHL